MNAQHSSDSVEHFTPEPIVEAARRLMQVIELDPASSAAANALIRARTIYTEADSGLTKTWRGRAFVNPPGGILDGAGRRVIRAAKGKKGCTVTGECGLPPGHEHNGVESSAVRFWEKLVAEWTIGNVECAVFVGFSLEILQRSQRCSMSLLDFPCCYPSERLAFDRMVDGERVSGTQPTHANVIAWLTPRWDPRGEKFAAEFGQFGKVVR